MLEPRLGSLPGDPRWIRTRWPGTCAACRAPIPAHHHAFYYPRTRALYCAPCGERAHADARTACGEAF